MAVNIRLSEKQARDLAAAIYNDIKTYIAAHQAEYEAFLKSEMREEELECISISSEADPK